MAALTRIIRTSGLRRCGSVMKLNQVGQYEKKNAGKCRPFHGDVQSNVAITSPHVSPSL